MKPRIGQKNKLSHADGPDVARARGRPAQRTEWAYIFGAICPAKGRRPLVMPWCDTTPWRRSLIEISAVVDPGAHAG